MSHAPGDFPRGATSGFPGDPPRGATSGFPDDPPNDATSDPSSGAPRRAEGEGHRPKRAADGEPGWLSSRLVHDGRVVHLSVDQVRFPDGSRGELEMIRHPGAAAVVAFTGSPHASDPDILMVHQYRYAAGGWLYEIPAGLPHPGETWEACAQRELKEETGWHTANLRYLTCVRTTPGFTDEMIHIFAARDLTRGDVRPDEDEFIEVVSMPLSRVVEMVRAGEITDGKTMVAILFAHAFRSAI